jgi:hypothetical protein
MQIAFYKARGGFYNRLVRLVEGGPYSHCELIFADGVAASASYRDGGVRFKQIDFKPENWDILILPKRLEGPAREWFIDHNGLPYDLWGNVRFVFGMVPHCKNKWFCSEAIGAALGYSDSWRFGPNALFDIVLNL